MLNTKDYLTSIVRTIVPVTMGAILTWLAAHNIVIDGIFQDNLRLLLELVITGAYYALVRGFEHYVSPKFGWLLGIAKAPNYVEEPAVTKMETPDPATAK